MHKTGFLNTVSVGLRYVKNVKYFILLKSKKP